MRRNIIIMMCATALLSSCHIYRKYERPEGIDASKLYRDTVSVSDTLVSDTANFGNLPWREVFTDPTLQSLIEEALRNNINLQTARLKIDEARAALSTARISYAPSFALAPQGSLSHVVDNSNSQLGGQSVTKTYQLPVTASWDIDLFGSKLNNLRASKVGYNSALVYKQSVQCMLIANLANAYYTLMMLDEQLAITKETAIVWEKNVETMKAMLDAAMTNAAAVTQSEAAYQSVLASIPDLESSIRQVENTISLLLAKPGQSIPRGKLLEQHLPSGFSVGVPVQLLSNRPDVMMAELSLASCYYNTNIARSAFYPAISLSGTAGWTNSVGGMVVNPGKLILNALGSLTQPLFYRGANIAKLKIAKAQEEEAKLAFQQALLNAGNEVSDYLFQYQAAVRKAEHVNKNVEALEKGATYTKELFQLGTSSYLEVLTAEQSLLSARLNQVANDFDCMQAVVNVYQALGGGRNE